MNYPDQFFYLFEGRNDAILKEKVDFVIRNGNLAEMNEKH
jgi:hypothetical protein